MPHMVIVLLLLSLPFSVGLAAQDQDSQATDERPERKPREMRWPLPEVDDFEMPRKEAVSTRKEEPLLRSPSSVTVISGDDVRRSGARWVADALRLAPGLEVQRISSTESNVNSRGYNDISTAAQGMLGLIDGRQVYNDFFGNVLWDQLPVSLEQVERLEVIRGPGSFVHGPNAMHGLVNIVTRSPLDYEKDTIRLSGAYGSYHSTVATLGFVKKSENSGFKGTFGWDNIRQFDARDEDASNKAFMELRFASKLGGDDEHRIELTGGASDQNLDILIPTLVGRIGTIGYRIPTATFANEAEEVFLKADYRYRGLKAQLYWNGFESSSAPQGNYAPFSLQLDTVDLDVQYTATALDCHTFTAGGGLRYATFLTKDQDVADGRHSTGLAWVFLQDEFAVADRVHLTAGLRVDRHSISGTNLAPRLAAVWEFADAQTLRGSVGYGYRNPSLREIWFDMPVVVELGGVPQPATIVGNDDLEAEQLRSFEIGYRGRPLARLRAGVTAYYNRVDDLVQFDAVAPQVLAPINKDDEEAWGLELEAEYLFSDSIAGFFNYSYATRRDRDTNERNKLAPRHKANLGVRVSSALGFRGMLWVNYFDETELEGAVADAYTLLNGSVSYAFPLGKAQSTLFVKAFNLLDNDHKEHPEGAEYGLILQGGFAIDW